MLEQGLVEFVGRVRARPARRPQPTPTAPTVRRADPARARCPTPSASAWPRSTTPGPRRPPRREARATRRRDLALVGVYLFDRRHPRGGAGHRAVRPGRAGDHRRHPVAHRPRPPRAPRAPRRVGGSTPARRTRCSSANRLVLETLEPRIDGIVDEDPPARRPGRDRGGRRRSRLDRPGPGDHRRRTRLVNSYVGPFTAIGARLRDRRLRDRALGRAGAQPHRRRPPHRRTPDRQGGRGRAHPTAPAGHCGSMVGDHCRVDVE